MAYVDDEKVFFEDPMIHRTPPGQFGTLYLLRRDVKRCRDYQILWPGAMGIMAGIDLLGKFLAGNDDVGSVGSRFKAFVTAYLHQTSSDAESLYQLRNALLHSFGLYSRTKTKIYRFGLIETGGALLSTMPSGEQLVCLEELYKDFEKAVEEYRLALHGDVNLQMLFSRMYPDFGAIPIKP